MKLLCTITLLLCLAALANGTESNITASCLTGAVPFPFPNITDCPLGFYCPFSPLPPTFCSPTLDCSLLRLGNTLCQPQGTTEPVVCPRGYYCETPLTSEKCPQGYFCSTGTHKPSKCPPLSICPEGSYRARFIGSFIICLLIDLALLTAWLLIKFYPSLAQRCRIRSNSNASSSRAPPSLRAIEMASKKPYATQPEGSDGVVSQGLVEGFTRARENQDVALLFEFENLSITLRGGLNILQGVSGSIRPGRVTAIMGPSGAGKTTFMNCLMGKVPRTGGSLRINRKDLEIHTLRKVIGYVPQDDVMLSELTVKENIQHSAKIRLPKSWTSKETSEFVNSVLEALDLSHVANTVVGDQTRRGISGGQKKRTNIAMELAAAPLAIFLDEPTSGLDSTAALKVAEPTTFCNSNLIFPPLPTSPFTELASSTRMTETLVKQYLLSKKAAVQWIQNVLAEETLPGLKDDLFQHLVDGVTLCKIMQKIAPNLIPRIKMPVMKKRATLTVFKTSENVSFFLQACEEIGVPRQKRFVLHDLVAKKGDAIAYSSSKRVMECLEALCELATNDKKYDFSVKWPVLDISKVVFTKDELQSARHMVEEYQKTEEKKEGVEKKFLMSPSDDAKKKEMIKNKAAAKLQAVVRGWLARNRYRTMLRSQAYRDHVAQEILSTERVYVEHLEFLVKEVIVPLRSAVGTSSQILADPEIRVIFSETESILNYNRHLLLQLEERVPKWSVSQRLGDIFLLISNFLKIYTQYCSNYSEAMRILSECKKQSKFKKFLDELKKKCHDIEHRGIEDYLIRPVQRIPRYYLLLQDLVKHTSKDHPDYANLASAAQKVQAVAEYMNGKKREAENIMKVTEVQDMIEGDIEPLAKPHRRFVKEGQLHEIGKGTARKVAVVLFLFNDMLVITKVQGTSFLSRSKTQKLHYHNNFALVGTQTISLENSTVFQHGFQVLRLKSKRSVTLLASSDESKAEWIDAINAEIKGATQQEQAHDKRTERAVQDKVATALDKINKQYQAPPPASPRGSFILTSSGSPSGSPEPPRSPTGASSGSVINLFKGGSGSSGNLPTVSTLSTLSSSSTSSLTNSGGSDPEGEVKRMSVREKRMQLMHQARRSGSIPNSPSLTSSTSLNGSNGHPA